jgi:hypothetical protein
MQLLLLLLRLPSGSSSSVYVLSNCCRVNKAQQVLQGAAMHVL